MPSLRPRRPSLRRSLAGLALVLVVPGLVLTVLLALWGWSELRRSSVEASVRTAGTLAGVVATEVARVEARLGAVADAVVGLSLDPVAERLALGALDQPGWQRVALVSSSGEALASWPSGGGAPVAPGAVWAQRTTVVTGWQTDAGGIPFWAVAVPVFDQGRVAAAVVAVLSPSVLAEALVRVPLPRDSLAAILDRDGRLLARTLDPEAWLGQRASTELVAALARAPSGSVDAPTVEGIPTLASYFRVANTGWGVVVGTPRQVIEGEAWRSALGIVLASVLVFGLGLGLAWRLSHRVSKTIRDLNALARSIGQGHPLPPVTEGFVETQDIALALGQAARDFENEHHRATHDALTGLPNRVLFAELAGRQVARADRDQGSLAVLALDLDGFKAINDQLGHGAGDEVLQEVARRIRQSLRTSDPAARIGGDEFLVLLDGVDRSTALLIAGRLVASLSKDYPGVPLALSSSIGVALFPSGGRDLEGLTQAADRALYRAKAAGKRCVAIEP